ncbi:MAG TPA: polysaccharide pyruvyl transferase family protein [Clostridia bacterium]|nr:polysaccharide pyruvyl transferase family protein [Clostridia bacterium]
MKAGILTFHHAHHYGAQLQAYALMRAARKAGAECEIIDYVRTDTVEGNRLFKKGLSARSMLSNANTLINLGRLKNRYARFESFVHDDMNLSEKFYGSYEQLKNDAPVYDVYICGSDQIWNPLIYKENTFDPAFFADFAKDGRRIAYAPSFGISSIPEDKRELLKNYLERFECLSVREKQGESIIREITGREAQTVLDPTLLLDGDDWSSISAAPAFKEPYILCYFITDARKYGDFVQVLSDKYKLPVVSLCGSRRVVPQTRHSVLDAGPKEFLGLFRNAAAVLTDSFHGTVFSINFKREFYSFESSQKSEKAVNSRLYSILDRLGLLSRIFPHTMELEEFKNKVDTLSKAIDYSEVEKLLEKERNVSADYLKGALGL